MFKNGGYKYPLILAIILHMVVFALLFAKFSKQHQYTQTNKFINIIHATVGAVREPPVVTPPKKIKKNIKHKKPHKQKIKHHKPVGANNHSPAKKSPIKKHKVINKKTINPKQHHKVVHHKPVMIEHPVRANHHSPLPKKQKHVHKTTAKKINPKQQAAIQKAMQQQILAEQKIMAARAQQRQGEIDKYKAQILQAISQNWIAPLNLPQGIFCKLLVHMAPGGVVLRVDMLQSSGNAVLDRSAKTAVLKASPLPVPNDPDLFDNFRLIRLTVKPQGVF